MSMRHWYNQKESSPWAQEPDKDGKDMLARYHPEALETKPTSLEAFFA